MFKHLFIFSPTQSWLGEGVIKLNMIAEELGFFTRWRVLPKNEEGRIECIQEIQVKGLSDIVHNQFTLFDFSSGSFSLELENQALGKVNGKGVVNENLIGWELKLDDMGFEGFEFYEKQPDNSYLMQAEYATADQFRTVIHGRIWQQMEQKE